MPYFHFVRKIENQEEYATVLETTHWSLNKTGLTQKYAGWKL